MTAFVSTRNKKPETKHAGITGDLLNCENNVAGGSGQLRSDDATASSSSFGNTFSDDESREYETDNEVMSSLRVDAAPMHGRVGSGDLFPLRKKKVTSHWRKFIQPIMWRCQWLELQARKFESIAVMYDKELEKHYKTKELKYKNFELEGCCAKSMPYVHDSKRQKLMKRKIRKKHEDSDTNMCMLYQNISSHLATRGSPAPGRTMDVDETSLAGPSSPKNTCNEFRVPDELEQMLCKIEVSQSKVCKMKDRLDVVMSENNERILATENLMLREYSKTVSEPVKEPDFLTDVDEPSLYATFASQLMKLTTRHDVVKHENGTSEFIDDHDANEPVELPYFASRKRSTDGTLIYNRRVKKQQTDSGALNFHPIENLQVPEEENNYTIPVSVSEDSSQKEQPAPKIRSISKLTTPNNTNKRPVGRPRRKTGPGVWNRRTLD
ncbi:uncharacterized protein LOC143610079 [Bidens hawaiensis]|uniref:uncharacterized protein LOC143610079 n=1 Tax=Bidens hawaiensis TaxID=980011 RepID=UPI004049453B